MVKEKKKNGNKTLEELAKFIQSPSKLTFQRAKKLLRPICGRTLLGQLLKDIVLEAFNRGEERPFLATIQFYTHIDAAEREYGKNTQFNRLALNERFQIGKACILDDQNKTDKKIADTLENKLGTTTFFQAMYYETSVSLFELEKDKIPSTVLSAAKHLILYGLSLQRPFFVQEGADMLKQIINNNNPNINALLSRVYYEQGKYLESLEIIEKISNCENLEELTYMPKDIKRFKRKLMRSIKQNRSRLCYFIDRFEIDSLDHRILSHNNSIEGGEGHNNFNETIAQIEKFLDSTAHNKTKEKEYFMCIQAYNEALIKLLKPKKRLPQQLEADINLLIAKNCLRSEDIKAAERYCKKAIKLADEEESRLSHMCLLAQIYEHQYSLLPNPFGSGFIGKSQNQMLALWQKIILTYVERFVQRLETAPPVTSINVASNENLANHGILIKRETDTTAFERTSAFTMLTQKRDAMYIDFFPYYLLSISRANGGYMFFRESKGQTLHRTLENIASAGVSGTKARFIKQILAKAACETLANLCNLLNKKEPIFSLQKDRKYRNHKEEVCRLTEFNNQDKSIKKIIQPDMAPNYLKYMYKTLKIIKKRQQLSGNEWFDVLNGGKHIITHLESAPHYISHGDTHLENLVNIEVNFNNEPELAKVGIVDFGHAKLVTASYDLAILLEQDGFGFNYEDKNELIGHYARLLKEKGIVRAINTEEYDYNAVYVCILGANTFSSGKMEQKYTQEECLGKAVWYYSNAYEALDRIMTRTPETMDPLKPLYSVLQTECQKLEETGHL